VTAKGSNMKALSFFGIFQYGMIVKSHMHKGYNWFL